MSHPVEATNRFGLLYKVIEAQVFSSVCALLYMHGAIINKAQDFVKI